MSMRNSSSTKSHTLTTEPTHKENITYKPPKKTVGESMHHRTNTLDAPTHKEQILLTERNTNATQKVTHQKHDSSSIIIKQRQNCVKILQEIIAQLENSLNVKLLAKEKLIKKGKEVNSNSAVITNSALHQLKNAQKLIETQSGCMNDGIQHINTIIEQTHEYYDMTFEDMASHVNSKIEQIEKYEELADLLSRVQKLHRSEEYELFKKIEPNDETAKQLYEYSKQKSFAIRILKKMKLTPDQYKDANMIIEGDTLVPLQDIESITKLSLANTFLEYSHTVDQVNERKYCWEKEIHRQTIDAQKIVTYHSNIADSILQPQLASYEQFITGCKSKEDCMRKQLVILLDSSQTVQKQLSELNSKQNNINQDSLTAKDEIVQLDKEILKTKEELIKRKKEIKDLIKNIDKLNSTHITMQK